FPRCAISGADVTDQRFRANSPGNNEPSPMAAAALPRSQAAATLRTLAAHAARLLAVDRATVLLRDPDDPGRLVAVATSGGDAEGAADAIDRCLADAEPVIAAGGG